MKRLWLTLFLCLVCLVVPVVHLAQGSPIMTGLDISLWPEYDRPGVLVIYHGQFDPAGTFPLPVEIAVPAQVEAPHAVAYVSEEGGRFNLDYTTELDGDRMIVAFELPTPNFQLEYYDELSVSDDDVREYTFAYTADYPVRELTVELQEPPLAQELQLDPAADSSSVAADGLRYHVLDAGSVEQDASLTWTFQYLKQDDRLTTAFFEQAQPTPPPAQPAAAPQSNSTVAIFVVAFAALIGVGVAAYWLGQRTQSPAPGKVSGSAAPARRKRDRDGRVAGAYYCHKCGAEIRDDAHFCNSCGAAVRRE